MIKRSFLCLAAIAIFWAIAWTFLPRLLDAFTRSWDEQSASCRLVLGAGGWLLTLPGTFFGWTALRSAPRKSWAAAAFALNLVVFLLSFGCFVETLFKPWQPGALGCE
jgi:hypothetical protein